MAMIYFGIRVLALISILVMYCCKVPSLNNVSTQHGVDNQLRRSSGPAHGVLSVVAERIVCRVA